MYSSGAVADAAADARASVAAGAAVEVETVGSAVARTASWLRLRRVAGWAGVGAQAWESGALAQALRPLLTACSERSCTSPIWRRGQGWRGGRRRRRWPGPEPSAPAGHQPGLQAVWTWCERAGKVNWRRRGSAALPALGAARRHARWRPPRARPRAASNSAAARALIRPPPTWQASCHVCKRVQEPWLRRGPGGARRPRPAAAAAPAATSGAGTVLPLTRQRQPFKPAEFFKMKMQEAASCCWPSPGEGGQSCLRRAAAGGGGRRRLPTAHAS